MKAFFKEIFEYNHYFNQKLIAELTQYKDQLPERTYPLFCHNLNAHQIWNARLLFTTPFGVNQVYSCEKAKQIDTINLENSLKIINDLDMDTKITYTNPKNETFVNTVQDILFHTINHHTHHKGQIISDFRQAGIEPIMVDYIFLKRGGFSKS